MLEQIPNLITLLRIASIVPICWLLWQDAYLIALFCLVLAGLSDALDGFLARRYGWFTRLGAMLDPVADKLFITSIILVFGFKGYLPMWLVWMVLGRDVLIIGGALFYRWITGGIEMRPLIISKLNTALQITLLVVTLLHVGFYPLPEIVNQSLQLLVAVTTLASGVAYVGLWTYYAMHRGASV